MDASQTTTIPAPGLEPQDRLGVARRWPGRACGRGWCRCCRSSRCSSPPPISICSPASTPGSIPAFWPPWRWPSSASAGGGCAISRWPAQEAAIRRLERDSGVPHRPLVAVQDSLAAGSADPMASALWEAHRRREAERLAGLSNKAGPSRPGRARHLGAALRAAPRPDRGHRRRRRLAQRSHGGGLHAGLPAAAAGRRQSVDRAAGLYRQAADLSRHGRPRQAPARARRQQARGLRRRRARPQAAASW